jgi:hypothetical protein
VYAALAQFNVNVVGGRVSGVGVAGFTLGGGIWPSLHLALYTMLMPISTGYSWKTNQFGLTIDTVVAYQLVKPNGDIVTVTASSDPDLFFGLKVL